MTDYVKSTSFASKDSLASGNPLKIVKGTEIDTEFNNIATAIATKANSASPAFSGTPTAPTQDVGDNTTKLATTAFVTSAVSAYSTGLTIGESKIEANAVTTSKIKDLNVTSDKLALSGVTAGTYGSSTAIPVVTVSNKGLVTSVSTSNIELVGAGQTWQKPSRALSYTYTNSTSKPIMVSVAVSIGNAVTTTVNVGGVVVSTFTGRDGAYIQNTYATVNHSFMVPAGVQYTVFGGSLVDWAELR